MIVKKILVDKTKVLSDVTVSSFRLLYQSTIKNSMILSPFKNICTVPTSSNVLYFNMLQNLLVKRLSIKAHFIMQQNTYKSKKITIKETRHTKRLKID